MSTVPNAPTGGHPSVLSSPPGAPPRPAEWLAAVRSLAEDVIAAGLDATAPPGARDLGRRAARRIITDAGSALRQMLDVAAAPPVPEADRGAAGGDA